MQLPWPQEMQQQRKRREKQPAVPCTKLSRAEALVISQCWLHRGAGYVTVLVTSGYWLHTSACYIMVLVRHGAGYFTVLVTLVLVTSQC